MPNSPAVQAARKKQQLERLKLKGKKEYLTFFAAQPSEVERAAQNATYRGNLSALRVARDALDVAMIDGVDLAQAKKTLAIATLVADRSKPAVRGENNAAGLSGA